ncbi:hypothetical protein BOTBODRAFT_55745 [Botryobasidium botryosum FD-172 SS1]|uniref:Uncharacterized protein n=1 Tax=Botryobasidium botryosum (strain FD-172 SS1) TaxID=930990 RepID=A0A067MQ47_BOTB1|nr:hypothetical protein BOTBODRAFT_55745 [Botryobasidium botryosum FD-172 SS1]
MNRFMRLLQVRKALRAPKFRKILIGSGSRPESSDAAEDRQSESRNRSFRIIIMYFSELLHVLVVHLLLYLVFR